MKYIYTLIAIVFCNYTYAINDALKIKVTKGTYFDETVIRFLQNATPGFDASYDAYKQFTSSTQAPSIYTKTITQSSLSINALPMNTGLFSIPIRLLVNVSGMYSLKSIELGKFPAGTSLMLKDRNTGVVYDFSNGSIVNLNLQANTLITNEIFELFISPPVSIIAFNETCANLNNGSVVLSKDGDPSWFYSIKDSVGTILYVDSNLSGRAEIINMAPGIYFLSSGSEISITAIDTIYIMPGIFVSAGFKIIPGEDNAGSSIELVNTSITTGSYSWNFGDQDSSNEYEPSHQFSASGTYIIGLTVQLGECSHTSNDTILIGNRFITNVLENQDRNIHSIYNDGNILYVNGMLNTSEPGIISLISLNGQQVNSRKVNKDYKEQFEVPKPGIYFLHFMENGVSETSKVLVNF